MYLTDSEEQMPGDRGTACPATRAQRALELLRASHPRLLRQHPPVLPVSLANTSDRRAGRGPCGGARQGRRGRPGYASAHGSRGPSPADGCSAGTCACSLELPVRCGNCRLIIGRHAMCRAVRLGPDTGRVAIAGGTWVSLLTVKAISAQVKLNHRGAARGFRVRRRPAHSRVYHRGTPRFPQRRRLRRPRLWKIRVRRPATRQPAAAAGWENRTQRAFTPCGRSCGQRVMMRTGRTRRGSGRWRGEGSAR